MSTTCGLRRFSKTQRARSKTAAAGAADLPDGDLGLIPADLRGSDPAVTMQAAPLRGSGPSSLDFYAFTQTALA